MTFLLVSAYGNHLSIRTACGLAGSGAIFSTMTFLGGGASLLPAMVINLRPTGAGGAGGA